MCSTHFAIGGRMSCRFGMGAFPADLVNGDDGDCSFFCSGFDKLSFFKIPGSLLKCH